MIKPCTVNQILEFSFSWRFSFFPLHVILLFYLNILLRCPLSMKVPQRSQSRFAGLCSVLPHKPFYSLIHKAHTSVLLMHLSKDIEFLQCTLKKCLQVSYSLLGQSLGKTKPKYDQLSGSTHVSQVTSGYSLWASRLSRPCENYLA